MTTTSKTRIPAIIKANEADLLADWLREQQAGFSGQALLKEAELREKCADFLKYLAQGAERENLRDVSTPGWQPIRELLGNVSHSFAIQGLTPSQTATFVFSFKKPLFTRLLAELGNDAEALAAEMWEATELLDKFGLYTIEVHQKSREAIIGRQQEELLELSTPVVTLWEGVLALPLIGTLDSSRTQVVMQSLLQKIVETGSDVAIIDITGVPTVDTLVAQHLMKTVTAARLMGADCIVSGIRPQIAQTIVHLGVNLGEVTTKANLKDALAMAMKRRGLSVVRNRREKVSLDPGTEQE